MKTCSSKVDTSKISDKDGRPRCHLTLEKAYLVVTTCSGHSGAIWVDVNGQDGIARVPQPIWACDKHDAFKYAYDPKNCVLLVQKVQEWCFFY